MRDILHEIKFQTARSGGKGGQNVNKVETMVEGYWYVNGSTLFTDDEKARIHLKLNNRINKNGLLLVKSQTEKTQAANKALVIEKMNALIQKALIVQKPRKATKLSKAAKMKRLESKQRIGALKQSRRKPIRHDES